MVGKKMGLGTDAEGKTKRQKDETLNLLLSRFAAPDLNLKVNRLRFQVQFSD
jgi:hypothetical protein